MASLDIPSEANDEDADIIFDYSSDENPYENPYTEYNFAQKRKKSYVDEDLQREFDYKPPTQTERYLYQQGKIKTKKNKWEQIPPSPKNPQSSSPSPGEKEFMKEKKTLKNNTSELKVTESKMMTSRSYYRGQSIKNSITIAQKYCGREASTTNDERLTG
ncbi:hypothetical protein Tco_0418804 [Tanacetum coccineum]